MNVSPGDWIEYHHDGHAYTALVLDVIYAGVLQVRLQQDNPGHPRLIPVRQCKRIENQLSGACP